ncbi:MAG: exodeoxyribonuclease VII large subunit [Thermodesulfobacteriota bacterium]
MFATTIPVQTVSELTRSIRGLIEAHFPFVAVAGEISNLRRPLSGHLYFSLKDQEAQLKAVLFKPQLRYLAMTPADGLEVVCRGRLSVYEPRGEYQLVVDLMEPRGVGALQLAFEALKGRLAAEGLFAAERKRPLPVLPERIALITSPAAAALFDFLRLARQRCPGVAIDIHPARVQGEGAAAEMVEALTRIQALRPADVIVLCRGGGSAEDLAQFNDEGLARAIAASTIPVVSAVGHETDFTIADLVADLRAPTPTAAVALVLPDRRRLLEAICELEGRLGRALGRRLVQERQALVGLRRALGDPRALLDHQLLRLDYGVQGLRQAMIARLQAGTGALLRLQALLGSQSPAERLFRQAQRREHLRRELNQLMRQRLAFGRSRLERLVGVLQAVSPLAVLGRGYALVRTTPDGVVVRDSGQVARGQELSVRLAAGQLLVRVLETGRGEDGGK